MSLSIIIENLDLGSESSMGENDATVEPLNKKDDVEKINNRYLNHTSFLYSAFDKRPTEAKHYRQILNQNMDEQITEQLEKIGLLDLIKSDVNHAFSHGIGKSESRSAAFDLIKAAMYCLPLREVIDPLLKEVVKKENLSPDHYHIFRMFVLRVVDELECFNAGPAPITGLFNYDESAFKLKIEQPDRYRNVPEEYSVGQDHWDLIKAMVSKAMVDLGKEEYAEPAFHFLITCLSTTSSTSLFDLSDVKKLIENVQENPSENNLSQYLFVFRFLKFVPFSCGFFVLDGSEKEKRQRLDFIKKTIKSQQFLTSLEDVVEKLGDGKATEESRLMHNFLIALCLDSSFDFLEGLEQHRKLLKRAIESWIKYDLGKADTCFGQVLLYSYAYPSDYSDLLRKLNEAVENAEDISPSSLTEVAKSFYALVLRGKVKRGSLGYKRVVKQLTSLMCQVVEKGLSNEGSAKDSLNFLRMFYKPGDDHDLISFVQRFMVKSVPHQDPPPILSTLQADIFSVEVVETLLDHIKNNLSKPDAPKENNELLEDLQRLFRGCDRSTNPSLREAYFAPQRRRNKSRKKEISKNS